MRRLRPELYIGPSVHPTDVARLRRAGVTAVLSLQQPEVDLPRTAMERMREACEVQAIAFQNIGIPDYDPDAIIVALPSALACLEGLVRAGSVVYLHCTEGINRAPSVALAYLVRNEMLSVRAALVDLHHCDPGARPYAEVTRWLAQREAAARPRAGDEAAARRRRI